MKIPKSIAKLVEMMEYKAETIGMSGASVLIFDDKVLKFEKVSEESNHEVRMMEQMKGKLPVPKVLCCEEQDG